MREFNRIVDLQDATNLQEGELVQLLGYHTAGDGGGHQRVISTTATFGKIPITGTSLFANVQEDFDQPINVKWFGVKNDASEDVSVTVQLILNNILGSNTFFFPKGNYRFENTITLLDNQNITGVSLQRDSSNQNLNAIDPRGTTFIANFAKGDIQKSLILLGHSTTLANVQILYSNQSPASSNTLEEFTWTIASTANITDNINIDNVVLYNSFKGIKLSDAGRFTLSNIYGNPLNRGISITNVSDEGRINNVHFWNFYTKRGANDSVDTAMEHYVSENLVGYEFFDCDGVHVSNCFVWNCHTGFKVTGSESRGGWINFTNCDIDKGSFACWHIENAQSVNVSNSTCIGNGKLNPAIYINSAGRLNFSNITTHPGTNAHAFQIDGDKEANVNITNLNTGCVSFPVVVTNPNAKVNICNMVGSKLPPLGQSNTTLDGIPLISPDDPVDLTWSYDTAKWELPIDNENVYTTTSDITYLSMRPTPKVLKITGVFPDSTGWHFSLKVQKDIGIDTAVDYATSSPIRLHGSGSVQTLYIPIHHGLLNYKSEIQITIAAHNALAGTKVTIDKIELFEQSSRTLLDSQIELFQTKGYFLDPYLYGKGVEKYGNNVRVVAKPIPGFRETIEPIAGEWKAGDRVYASNVDVINSGQAVEILCTSSGSYDPRPTWLPIITKP